MPFATPIAAAIRCAQLSVRLARLSDRKMKMLILGNQQQQIFISQRKIQE